jgi:hypothetical protein
MQPIYSVIRNARARIVLNLFLRALPWTLAAALGVLLITRITQQLLGLVINTVTTRENGTIIPGYREISLILLALAILSSIIYVIIKRPTPLAIAREIDERADLKESLSSALCVERATDNPWSQAVIDTAIDRARTVKIAQILPLEWTRAWAYPIAAGVALLIVWTTVKNYDLLHVTKKRDEIVQKQAQVVVAKAQAQKAEDQRHRAGEQAVLDAPALRARALADDRCA